MMKKFNVFASIGVVLLLIWISAASSALLIASSKEYYKKELRDCGIYATKFRDGTEKRRVVMRIGGDRDTQAKLSDEQLDAVVDHIVDYLFGNVQSFELVMDNVEIVDKGVVDGVSIFGKEAISHMADVKTLMHGVLISLFPCTLLLIFLIICLFKHAKPKDILKYTLSFLLCLAIFATVFCLWSYIGSDYSNPFLLNLWGNLHYILFAFQNDAYKGSFLLDALIYILTLDFFISAVVLVASVIAATLAIWITTLFLLAKYSKVKE